MTSRTVPVSATLHLTGDAVDGGHRSASAVRIRLPDGPSIDPFALAGADGVLLAGGGRVLVGLGAALTLALPHGSADLDGIDAATEALAAVACGPDDGPGHPVVALGALPFEGGAPASLVVPALLYRCESDGSEWVTAVTSDPSALPVPADAVALRDDLLARAAAHRPTDDSPAPGTLRIRPRSSDEEFRGAVAAAVDAIGTTDLVKVVLARNVDVDLGRAVDTAALLARWASLEPSCTVFAVPTPDGRFVGASPELLVARTGRAVRSRPLAGTTDRDHGVGSSLPAALLDSAKDTEEHRLVVDAVRTQLEPLTDQLQVPDGPELVHLHAITHLGTTVAGTLATRSDGTLPSALHLAALLHPTPAVGGVPRTDALDWIRRLEDGPRGSYAGPVGWVDGAGDGRWMVGIRALTVDGTTVRMTAGVGVVAGSRPETELVETHLKLSSVFEALAPGIPFDTTAPTG